eukprot:1331614-Karenia_brevis.AAC.1
MIFETGGGEVTADKSVRMEAPILGERQAYQMEDSPFCVLSGMVVADGMPRIWIPGLKPFYVTDRTKLKVFCPEKYRRYANRVEDNIPIFTETIK